MKVFRLPALLSALLFFALSGPPPAAAKMLIDEAESFYNSIFVFKDSAGYISMTFGHNRKFYVESRYNPRNQRELPVQYTRYMAMGLLYAARHRSALIIGLGGGRTSWYLHHYLPEIDITAVDIDAEVIRMAAKHFGVSAGDRLRIEESDGRSYLMRNAAAFDLIMLDAYRGPFVPFHLMTREFYDLTKRHLNPGGVVVQNIEPSTMLFDSAAKTMQAAFDNLEFFVARGNVVAVAYDGPALSAAELAQRAGVLQKSYNFYYPLEGLVAKRRFFTPDQAAEILTDDFAPVNALKAIEKHNRKWK